MELTKDILQEFKKITNKDIERFFVDSVAFFSSDYNTISSYYSGQSSVPPKRAFDRFDALELSCSKMLGTFQQMKIRLNNLKWFIILEFVEQIDSRLKTLRKINKWSRSSYKGVGYDPSYQVSYMLKQGQTVERAAREVLNDNNPDRWYDIELENQLKEEDYTSAGGGVIKLNLPNVNNGLRSQSVVAVMIDKAIYGKDIYKKIQFDIADQDLKFLDYDETIDQAVNILANLKRNDSPSFPNDGLQRDVIIGGSRASLNFPIIQRQMASVFATDDSLKDFNITSISIEQDQLLLNFEVRTRLNEVIGINSALV